MKTIARKSVITLLCFILAITLFSFGNLDKSYGATQYVTMDEHAYYGTYWGGVTVYKDASLSTIWKYTDSNGKVYNATISKGVYLKYLSTPTSSVYEVQWGNSTGYVRQIKTKKVSSLSDGEKIPGRRRLHIGATTNRYIAFNSYITYRNESLNRIVWAPYCNSSTNTTPSDWVLDSYATMYTMP